MNKNSERKIFNPFKNTLVMMLLQAFAGLEILGASYAYSIGSYFLMVFLVVTSCCLWLSCQVSVRISEIVLK